MMWSSCKHASSQLKSGLTNCSTELQLVNLKYTIIPLNNDEINHASYHLLARLSVSVGRAERLLGLHRSTEELKHLPKA